MKMQLTALAALAASTWLPCACTPAAAPATGNPSAVVGYSSRQAWTEASYDPQGFPIFGYTYGRPIYGYTAEGAAIYSFAALASGCFAPQWEPAPWYRGDQRYRSGLHRVAAPPKSPRGHKPANRPAGGQEALIHRNPGAAFGWHTPGPNPLPDVPLPVRVVVPVYESSSSSDDDWDDDWNEQQREQDRQNERDRHHQDDCGHHHKNSNHHCKHHN